tara:strand:- start:314 stop:1030 length:717 start_codon:yes stop_codon:yes gene_type:complete
MIYIKIGNDKQVELPNKWSELTIESYAKIISLVRHYEIHRDIDNDGELTEAQIKKQILNNLKCSREIFAYLTKLTNDEVDKINENQMNTIINTMTELLNSNESLKKNWQQKFDANLFNESFDFKGKTYYFPKVNMQDTTFGDYIETQQLQVAKADIDEGRFGVMAEQMAIMCKQKDVENTDNLIRKKTKLFEKLPMDIVWNFVFFLTMQTNTYTKNLETYLKTATETETDMQQKIGTS